MALVPYYTPLSLADLSANLLSVVRRSCRQLMHHSLGEAALVPFAWYGVTSSQIIADRLLGHLMSNKLVLMLKC